MIVHIHAYGVCLRIHTHTIESTRNKFSSVENTLQIVVLHTKSFVVRHAVPFGQSFMCVVTIVCVRGNNRVSVQEHKTIFVFQITTVTLCCEQIA